jgi:hypothetical protein
MGFNGIYPLVNKQFDPENHPCLKWKLIFQVLFARVELLIYQRDPEGNLYYNGLI